MKARLYEIWDGDLLLLVTSERSVALESTQPGDTLIESEWVRAS